MRTGHGLGWVRPLSSLHYAWIKMRSYISYGPDVVGSLYLCSRSKKSHAPGHSADLVLDFRSVCTCVSAGRHLDILNRIFSDHCQLFLQDLGARIITCRSRYHCSCWYPFDLLCECFHRLQQDHPLSPTSQGFLIISFVITLHGRMGSIYHVPFPVLNRPAWGVNGVYCMHLALL